MPRCHSCQGKYSLRLRRPHRPHGPYSIGKENCTHTHIPRPCGGLHKCVYACMRIRVNVSFSVGIVPACIHMEYGYTTRVPSRVRRGLMHWRIELRVCQAHTTTSMQNISEIRVLHLRHLILESCKCEVTGTIGIKACKHDLQKLRVTKQLHALSQCYIIIADICVVLLWSVHDEKEAKHIWWILPLISCHIRRILFHCAECGGNKSCSQIVWFYSWSFSEWQTIEVGIQITKICPRAAQGHRWFLHWSKVPHELAFRMQFLRFMLQTGRLSTENAKCGYAALGTNLESFRYEWTKRRAFEFCHIALARISFCKCTRTISLLCCRLILRRLFVSHVKEMARLWAGKTAWGIPSSSSWGTVELLQKIDAILCGHVLCVSKRGPAATGLQLRSTYFPCAAPAVARVMALRAMGCSLMGVSKVFLRHVAPTRYGDQTVP